MIRPTSAGVLGMGLLLAGTGTLPAGELPVPNASFELPTTPFVSISIEAWQKSPRPAWYPEGGDFQWDQLTGLFKNPSAGSAEHIVNCDGDQAAWLFAVPEVALFQEPDSPAGKDPSPARGFDARFEVGKSYRLTVGVIGMGGGMTNGVPLEIGLFYRDAASDQVAVATTTVTNTAALFSSRTRFVDYAVQVPGVEAGDAWAGRPIGIRFRSTVSPEMQGGFWDLDRVRLQSFDPPALRAPAWNAGRFEATLEGEPGGVFEILASPDVARPLSEWAPLLVLTNVTGTIRFTDASASADQRFYRARQSP